MIHIEGEGNWLNNLELPGPNHLDLAEDPLLFLLI
jgi:hypothetical protein